MHIGKMAQKGGIENFLGYEGWQKFDIDCQDALPADVAFTDNARTIVISEHKSNIPAGRLVYHAVPSDQKNDPEISNAINWIVSIVPSSRRVGSGS